MIPNFPLRGIAYPPKLLYNTLAPLPLGLQLDSCMTSYPYPPHILVRAAILQEPGKIPAAQPGIGSDPTSRSSHPYSPNAPSFSIVSDFFTQNLDPRQEWHPALPGGRCASVAFHFCAAVGHQRSAFENPAVVFRPPSSVGCPPSSAAYPASVAVFRPFPLTISPVQRIIISIYIELIR